MNIDESIKKMLGQKNTSKKPIQNKSNELLNLAKGSVFFPFTQPTVKNPSTGRTIKGHMPNNILSNFGLKQFGGKNDLDCDGVINKKDCQPRNTMRQDMKQREKQFLFHGTTAEKYKNIKIEGLKKSPLDATELKRLKKNREGIFLASEIDDAKYFSKLGDATHAIVESEQMEKNKQNKKEFDSQGVHQSFYSKSEPVLLKVNVPEKKVNRVITGAFAPTHYYYREDIPPENIERISNKKEENYYKLIRKLAEYEQNIERLNGAIKRWEEDNTNTIYDYNTGEEIKISNEEFKKEKQTRINTLLKEKKENKQLYMKLYYDIKILGEELGKNDLSIFPIFGK